MIQKAGCVLINFETNDIALVYRDEHYSFPKGHLEIGETLQECAIRETKEETGHNCHIIDNNEIARLYYKNAKGEDIENYFYFAIDDGLTKDEIDEKDKEVTIWKNYKDIGEVLEYPILKDFWNKILKELESIINKKQNTDIESER